MQLVTGSRVFPTTPEDITAWTQSYERVAIDLGTGDGRYVANIARRSPQTAVIGVDLCAAIMATASRKAGANARFLVADACSLPADLIDLADQITIAFPWGSLLRNILCEKDSLITDLVHTMRPGAVLEIVINADAAKSCEMELSEAQSRIVTALAAAGGRRASVSSICARDLRMRSSTWAKRLAFGRDPHAIAISTRVLTGPGRSPGAIPGTATLYHQVR